jgi:organic radical activating enzyme
MNRLYELLDRVFPPKHPIPAGIYHYQSPPNAPAPYRLHLRLEPDGEGILIVNASTVLHLNQTAAEFAYYLVQQKPDQEAIAEVSSRYHVSREHAAQDYLALKERLQMLVSTPDLDPVTVLDFERQTPYSKNLSAPYRLDVALTYRTSDGESGVSPMDRVRRELTQEEWFTILDKAWAAGIPHVIFTGGEPTLRADLCDLVRHGEELGMVTGLLTDGLRLTDTKYFHELLQSGLDHLMLIFNPDEDQSWEAVRDVMVEDLFATIHLTITDQNQAQIPDLVDRLAAMGVRTFSLSTNDLALKDAVAEARQKVASLGTTLVWDLPVPYSRLHPVALELAETGEMPSGAGRAWLYVEPDGDVLKAQGLPTVLGNLLVDDWEKIWSQAQA